METPWYFVGEPTVGKWFGYILFEHLPVILSIPPLLIIVALALQYFIHRGKRHETTPTFRSRRAYRTDDDSKRVE